MARKMTEDYIGVCQWCLGEFKVNDHKTMVLHGYRRPGYGYTVGNCTGVAHAPFEYSHELTDERIEIMKDDVAKLDKQIAASFGKRPKHLDLE